MATATLTRGCGYELQMGTVRQTTSSNDWSWYIGQWRQDLWNVREYAAGCVEYTVPNISDGINGREITIPCKFLGNSGACTALAVISTKGPSTLDSEDPKYLEWRFGPTGGIISNVVTFYSRDTSLTFKINNSGIISGKKIYLYLYQNDQGYGTNGKGSSVVTSEFADATLSYGESYSLSVSSDSGCAATVNRTESRSGLTGNISGGSELYYGDKLKISFSPKSNYTIATHTVNGITHSSGGIHTVSSDVSVVATSQAKQTNITDASSVALGSVCSIKWTPSSSSHRYKIKFSIGSWSATTSIIHPNQTSLFTYSGYTIPLDVASELPDSVTGTMTATLYAYSDANATNQIGTSTFTFSVSVPSSVVPTINNLGVSIDNSAYSSISSWDIAIAGYSKAKLTASASGAYGSSIVSFTISGGYSTTQSGSSLNYIGAVITSSGSKTFTVTCKDSRGRTSKSVVTNAITFYKYSPPEITNFLIDRGTNSVTIKADWTYSSLSGKNAATAKLMYKLNTDSSWLTYSGEVKKNQTFTPSLSLSDPKKYDFKIVVTDALSSSDQSSGSSQIGNTDVLLDFKSDGAGLGIGRECLTNALEIGLTTKFYGAIEINDIALENYIRSLITSVLEQNGLISNTDG